MAPAATARENRTEIPMGYPIGSPNGYLMLPTRPDPTMKNNPPTPRRQSRLDEDDQPTIRTLIGSGPSTRKRPTRATRSTCGGATSRRAARTRRR
jgi:hypothetical protein